MDRVFGQFMDPRNSLTQRTPGQGLQSWAPHIDVSESEQEYHIEADLPGVRQEDIDIQVQDGMLTLRAQMQQREEQPQSAQSQPSQGQNAPEQQGQEHVSRDQDIGQNRDGNTMQTSDQTAQTPRRYHQRERRFGYFERIMSLPANVDEENIQAQFKDGVLTLRIPKQTQTPQSRRIQIQSGPSASSSGNSEPVQIKTGATNGRQEKGSTGSSAGAQQPVTTGTQSKS
ncbi:MAG: heat shock protein-like protein [Chthonomonadales bacterium]|nr:heat shock protein-like protein [Chthonomonadales bacterium]